MKRKLKKYEIYIKKMIERKSWLNILDRESTIRKYAEKAMVNRRAEGRTKRRAVSMEDQYKNQRPPMNGGRRFWYIWGPFLINWGIGIVISMAATMVFTGMYSLAHTKEMLDAYGNQQAMMQIMDKVAEFTQRYAAEVQGIAALITIPVMAFFYHRDRVRDKMYGKNLKKKAPAAWYIWIILLAGTLNLALNNLIIIGNLSNYSASYREITEAFYNPPLAIQILCLGVLAPAAEEMVFRGLMYRRMREETGFVTAMLYTSVVFGLFHGNVVQMIYGVFMGMMLAYVCEKYGSVAAPVTAHMTVNIVSILATYFQVYDRMLDNIWIVGTVTVACAAAAASVYLIIQGNCEKLEILKNSKED